MKKYLLLIVTLVLVQVALAQDVIVKTNGDELRAKVLEIRPTLIIYLSANATDSTKYRIAKADVFMVRFANGTKEVFQESLPSVSIDTESAGNPAAMYQNGRQDARLYYSGTGTLLGSAASVFVAGPVIPIVLGAIKPRAHNNAALPYTSLQDPNYVKGYEKQAHNRKIGKAALGFGIGSGVGILYILMSAFNGGQ